MEIGKSVRCVFSRVIRSIPSCLDQVANSRTESDNKLFEIYSERCIVSDQVSHGSSTDNYRFSSRGTLKVFCYREIVFQISATNRIYLLLQLLLCFKLTIMWTPVKTMMKTFLLLLRHPYLRQYLPQTKSTT